MNKAEAVVPFFGVSREFEKYGQEYIAAISSVLTHGKVLQGKEVSDIEKKIAVFCGREFAVAVNSGTDALFFALLSSGIKPGDEVLVTDFSFVASASCIIRIGAVPVFVDITDDYLMDLNKAKTKITSRTKALIFVHLYGQMGDPEEIVNFASFHEITLIEDAAQAFGANRKGFSAGSIGQISCLSFDPTKVIGAPGSGGMLLTNNSEISEQVRKLRYHGKNKFGEYETLGYNSQMSSITAAVLHCKFQHHDEWLSKRRTIADYYSKKLNKYCIVPHEHMESVHIYHKFVIKVDNRDELQTKLKQEGIECMVHYSAPLHQLPCFMFEANRQINPNNYFIAERSSKQVLSLPIHPFIKLEEMSRVVENIISFMKHKKID